MLAYLQIQPNSSLLKQKGHYRFTAAQQVKLFTIIIQSTHKAATEVDCDAILTTTRSNLSLLKDGIVFGPAVPCKAPLPPPLPCTMRQGSVCLSSTVFLIHSSFRKMLCKL